MYVARPSIEPRTSDLQARCPTDCATRPGLCKLTIQDGHQGPLVKLAYKHENDDISRTIC